MGRLLVRQFLILSTTNENSKQQQTGKSQNIMCAVIRLPSSSGSCMCAKIVIKWIVITRSLVK